jgi:polyisoprenoid-binding protein YceI
MRVCWLLPCLAMWAVQPARAADLFHLDQRYGTIAFSVSGTLLRSDYGMTAEPVMIANEVRLMIAARIELPAKRKPASP